jgi:hypothetical protein
MGRHSKYTDDLAQRIVAGLSDGVPLTQICAADDMPTDDTVRDWAKVNAEFAADIARAREAGHDAIAYRARLTARGEGDSTKDVQRDKLIIDTDLKLLAKWNPKRYGDKVSVVGGDKDDEPIRTELNVTGLSATALAELAALKVQGE